MAGSESAMSHRRLSVRAATEPLPTPLPPPPRIRPRDEPAAGAAVLHPAHRTPPPPHVIESENGFVEPDTVSAHTSALDRSLRSPGVLISLTASALLLAALGWFQMSERNDLRWQSVKSIVLGQLI